MSSIDSLNNLGMADSAGWIGTGGDELRF